MKCKFYELLKDIREKARDYFQRNIENNSIDRICSTHGAILDFLHNSENDKNSMSEIAVEINRSKSTVTELVNKLEKLGYVKKKCCMDDSRVIYVVLTKEGKNARKKYEDVYSSLINKTFKNFSSNEKKYILKMLKRIKKNL